MAHAERDAEPSRWQNYPAAEGLERLYSEYHPGEAQRSVVRQDDAEEAREEVEEQPPPSHHDGRHMSTVSSINSTLSSVRHESLRGGARQRPSRLDSTLSTTSTRLEKVFMVSHPSVKTPSQTFRYPNILASGVPRSTSDGYQTCRRPPAPAFPHSRRL